MSSEDRKTIALDFLRHARQGDRAAAERLFAEGATHHNPYVSAGIPALLDAIVEAARTAPGRTVEVKRVVAEADYVVVHSHIRHHSDDPGFAVVHIFRFEGDRIAEAWDVGQAVPESNPNSDGMF
jgi:predicted SnoaL-like aldol condensation-catalyzing enzyme